MRKLILRNGDVLPALGKLGNLEIGAWRKVYESKYWKLLK